MPNKSIFILSTLCFISLVIIALLPAPKKGADHYQMLTDPMLHGDSHLKEYSNYLQKNLTIDTVFIISFMTLWVIIYSTNSKNFITPLIAVLAGILDFCENSIKYATFLINENINAQTAAIAKIWLSISDISFFLMFIPLIAYSFQKSGKTFFKKLLFYYGFLGILFVGLLYTKFAALPFYWFIGYFLLLSLENFPASLNR